MTRWETAFLPWDLLCSPGRIAWEGDRYIYKYMDIATKRPNRPSGPIQWQHLQFCHIWDTSLYLIRKLSDVYLYEYHKLLHIFEETLRKTCVKSCNHVRTWVQWKFLGVLPRTRNLSYLVLDKYLLIIAQRIIDFDKVIIDGSTI